jgi:uncharacterized Rmd1/YagE family protein
MKRCFAYSYSKSFQMRILKEYLTERYKVINFDTVLHVRKTSPAILDTEGDVFIFPYGVIVTWGLTKELETEFSKSLIPFLDEHLGAIDDDLYTYSYDYEAKIEDDHITLPDKDIISKLSCSYALAQSAKLGGFENTIQNIFEQAKILPECMARKGKIHLSRKAILKLMGRIFVERNSINLHLRLLDTPNFFWNNTELEPLYDMIVKYVDQERRVNILNQQLVVLQELLDMLTTELNNQQSSKLEWVIIILIAFEITLTIVRDIFHIL